MKQRPIHCVFSTDSNYCPHLAVVLASLLDHNRHNPLVLHIIHQNVGEENVAKLETVLKAGHAQWAMHNFAAERYAHFYTSGHISLASYFRLFLTDILPESVDRVIYIDADIVVLDDLAPLASLPMAGPIAAVPDPFPGDSNQRLGLPGAHTYFNAGVLLIDLDKWRELGLRDRFIAFVEENQALLKYHDQDVLNCLMNDSVQYLDMRWNFQARTRLKDMLALGMTAEQYRAARQNPAIVHFTANQKPWLYKFDVPFEADYLRYREQTPWRAFRQPDKTAWRQVARALRRRAPFIFDAIHAVEWRLRKRLSAA